MSPMIAMVEGGGGACEESGGMWGLSFFFGGGRGVLVRGLALPAFLCPEGQEAWESVVGEGARQLRGSPEFALPDRRFFGALSAGGAGRGEGG